MVFLLLFLGVSGLVSLIVWVKGPLYLHCDCWVMLGLAREEVGFCSSKSLHVSRESLRIFPTKSHAPISSDCSANDKDEETTWVTLCSSGTGYT